MRISISLLLSAAFAAICLLLSAAFAAPALAEPLKFKPLLDARLRYEQVDQDGIVRKAEAVTARTRPGFELSTNDWAFLAEAEATLAIVEKYNSGLNGKALYPIVADPENVEINRFQLQYKGIDKTLVTLGRQRINLDDQRFVGSVGWRDNEQTFDAARIEYGGAKGLKLNLVYAWSDRTIWGIDGFGARPQASRGDNVFANAAYATKVGTLTGFAYLVDQDEAPVVRNSSRTFGLRFAGAMPLSKRASLGYAASYARQSDHGANPNDYSADYYLAEASVEASGFKLGGGYEVLGADQGVAFTSFQTPLATLHKFQGWADKFLVTPPNGIRDLHASLAWTGKKIGEIDLLNFAATYHRFDSDRLALDYGSELDLLASARRKQFTLLAKYAGYRADGFATATSKFWLSLEWAM